MVDSLPANPILLRDIILFRDLSSMERKEIARYLQLRHYSKNQPILARHDTGGDVHFVCKGRVRVTSFSRSGREASYNEKEVGELFGELAAIDGQSRAADVIALEDATTLHMSRADFLKVLNTYASVNKRLLQALTSNVRNLTDRVFEFTAMAVPARIRSELHRLGAQQLEKPCPEKTQFERRGTISILLDPAPKHAELASRVSTTREAVTREINVMIDSGLLEKSGPQKLLITDLRALEKSLRL
ncbi:MAG: Crp/Fnr family transcriptional regulator [Pseudomonadales bacterium]